MSILMGSDDPQLHRRDLVGLLEASVGAEKAASLVFDAAIKLGYGTFQYTESQAIDILSEIALEPGLIGIAAGLARTRVPRMIRDQTSGT